MDKPRRGPASAPPRQRAAISYVGGDVVSRGSQSTPWGLTAPGSGPSDFLEGHWDSTYPIARPLKAE